MFYRFGNFPYDERMVYFNIMCKVSASLTLGSDPCHTPSSFHGLLYQHTFWRGYLKNVYMNGMMKWAMEEQICYSSLRSMHNSVVLFCLLVVFVFVCSNLRYMCHNGTGLSGAGALLASSTTWVLFAWGTLSIGRIGSIFLCTSRTTLIFKLIFHNL